MNLSKEKLKEIRAELEAAYQHGAIDGFRDSTEYVERLLIEYYSKGYQDGLECRDE